MSEIEVVSVSKSHADIRPCKDHGTVLPFACSENCPTAHLGNGKTGVLCRSPYDDRMKKLHQPIWRPSRELFLQARRAAIAAITKVRSGDVDIRIKTEVHTSKAEVAVSLFYEGEEHSLIFGIGKAGRAYPKPGHCKVYLPNNLFGRAREAAEVAHVDKLLDLSTFNKSRKAQARMGK